MLENKETLLICPSCKVEYELINLRRNKHLYKDIFECPSCKKVKITITDWREGFSIDSDKSKFDTLPMLHEKIDVLEKENCPICNGKLDTIIYERYLCANECYYISYIEGFVSVFNECFYYNGAKNKKEEYLIYEKIQNAINYWRENDRYVMRILTNNK